MGLGGKLILKAIYLSTCIGLLEIAHLTYLYYPGESYAFIFKLLCMWWVWGLLLCAFISSSLLLFTRNIERTTTHAPWILQAILLFSYSGSYLFVSADYFYYRVNPLTLGALGLLLAMSLGLALKLHQFLVRLPRMKRILINIFYVGGIIFFILMPFSRTAGGKVSVAPADVRSAPLNFPNILLIIVDSLEASHISYMGYDRETSPYLDSLAKEGIVFSKFMTQGSSASTVASLFTGHDYTEMNYNYVDDIIEDRHYLLGELMADQGYQTAAFSFTHYIDSKFGFGQGINHFVNLSRVDPAGYSYLKRALWTIYKKYFPFRSLLKQAELFLAKAYDPKEEMQKNPLEYVEKHEEHKVMVQDADEKLFTFFFDWFDAAPAEPFFAFFHTQGVHIPLIVPEDFAHRFFSEEEGRVGQEKIEDLVLGRYTDMEDFPLFYSLYDTRLRYVDDMIRAFVTELKNRSLARELFIVIMGDHASSITIDKEEELEIISDPLKRSHPFLLFHYPNVLKKGAIVDKVVSDIDIMPTISDLLGVSLPQRIQGNSFKDSILGSAES